MPPKCQDITPLSMESVVLLVFIYLPFMNQTQYPEGISWCPAFLSRIMLFCNVKHHKLSHGSDYNFMWWKGFIEWVFPVFTSFCLLNRLWLCLVTSLQPSKFPNEFFWAFRGKSRCREARGRNKGFDLGGVCAWKDENFGCNDKKWWKIITSDYKSYLWWSRNFSKGIK